MKWCVLLVLVVVCQGTFIRNGPLEQFVDKQSNRAQLREKPIQVIKQNFMELSKLRQQLKKLNSLDSISLWKLDLSAVPQIQVKAPWISRYTPPGFLNYIQKFDRIPRNRQISINAGVLKYKTVENLMQFPGGDFLQQEIDKILWNALEDVDQPLFKQTDKYRKVFPLDMNLPVDLDVEGIENVLPFIVPKMEEIVPRYLEITDNPSTAALLVTRDLIKVVLYGRMKCATTTWDKQFIENIQTRLVHAINEHQYQLLENFKRSIPQVFPIEFDVEELVYTFTQDVQKQVYLDIMQYAHGVAFKDVAVVCHKLYRELKRVFEKNWRTDVPTLMQQLVGVVNDVMTNFGTCPSVEYYYRKNDYACWDFSKLFFQRELAHIHTRVLNIVHQFLKRTCISEECMQYYPRMTEAFRTILQQYITSIIQRVPVCQQPECRSPLNCFLLNKIPEFDRVHRYRLQTDLPMWIKMRKNVEQSRGRKW